MLSYKKWPPNASDRLYGSLSTFLFLYMSGQILINQLVCLLILVLLENCIEFLS